MRKSLVGAVCLSLVAGLVALRPGDPFDAAPAAAPVQPHEWRNVEIGGGGFVPGIVFSPAEAGLVYARTDIGGIYRLDDAGERWIPLLDWVGWDEWGWMGGVSVAPDPVDPDRVYAAVGMYTNDWDPGNGAILRSDDRGESWDVTELPFKLGGNMPGRGMGERLVVDPDDTDVLYLGAPSGNGLWRSTDAGATWAEVESFPNPGDHVAEPGDPYAGDVQGVVWAAFDPRSGGDGSPSQEIYVGVADKEDPLYRSIDGGATWEPVPGAPTGYLPKQAVLDPDGGFLYLATSDTGGPYDGAAGEVWKLDLASGAWTDISPVPVDSEDSWFGWSGLTIDRQDPDTLIVGTQVSWYPDTIFYRTTDGGATWSPIWEWAGYPERELRYRHDVSSVPWLATMHGSEPPAPPEVAPKLGWMNESIAIDPFDSDRFLYGTGATIYGTDDLTNWDAGEPITIRPVVAGLEETAVLDLASPPEGPPLLSALGDIGGFRHDDLDVIPDTIFVDPVFTNTTSIDYAEAAPQVVVRVGNFSAAERPDDAHVAVSTDGGATWSGGTDPGTVNLGGTVAVSADAGRIVWSPDDHDPVVSSDRGASWSPVTGLPRGARVESDRVDPERFTATADGTLHVSTDGGATFAAGATGLPEGARPSAVPGGEGHVWVAGDGGLWRSTDGGATVVAVEGVSQSNSVGFGAPAPGADHPAVYAVATVEGQRGAFRSDDAGATWTRINDDDHQFGNWGDAITGDPRRYGRVYVGTNGRGIVYADPVGAAPPSPTTTSSTTSTSVAEPPPTSSPTTTTAVAEPPTSTTTTVAERPPTSSPTTTTTVAETRPVRSPMLRALWAWLAGRR